MKITTIASVIAISLLMTACGRKNVEVNPDSPTPAPPVVISSSAPWQALTGWEQGDKSRAVSDFLATDWSGHLFSGTSLLSLTEEQFKALSDAQRAQGASEMSATLNTLRELEKAVLQAGRDAAAKGDTAGAGKYFTAVKACGTALDKQENTVVLIRLGQSFQRDADRELKGRNP